MLAFCHCSCYPAPHNHHPHYICFPHSLKTITYRGRQKKSPTNLQKYDVRFLEAVQNLIVCIWLVGYNCSLEISKWGWELQNRAWLPPMDRQAHDTYAQFFLPINFSANSAPQLILKILLVVSITVFCVI